jgi:flavodoxin
MKSLIICKSVHVGNTEKIAKRMAKALNAELIEPKECNLSGLGEFDLIGFGSGIYDYKHHSSLLNLADQLPDLKGKRVFVFSTSGVIMKKFHNDLKERLEEKNAVIVGEFFCKGFNKNSFLKYLGGMNKGRPNEDDLRAAEEFVSDMRE